jgi:hypothetical protein
MNADALDNKVEMFSDVPRNIEDIKKKLSR